jgi:hypothetical protein
MDQTDNGFHETDSKRDSILFEAFKVRNISFESFFPLLNSEYELLRSQCIHLFLSGQSTDFMKLGHMAAAINMKESGTTMYDVFCECLLDFINFKKIR